MSEIHKLTVEQIVNAIAQVQGHKVYHVSDTDGSPCFGQDRDWHWDYIVLPDGNCEGVPQYMTDMNAILRAVKDADLILTINFHARRAIVTTNGLHPESYIAYGESDNTPDAAIVSYAFLEWAIDQGKYQLPE